MESISIQDGAAIITILSALAAGLYFIFNEFKKKQKRYRELLQGNWGNEGVIGGPEESHYMDMQLTVDVEDGSVSGVINSRDLNVEGEMSFGLDGKLSYKEVKLYVTKIRHGNIHQYGYIQVRFLNKRNVQFTSKDENDFFSKDTVMFKTEFNLEEYK